jgi:hypothetical protein
MFQTIALVRRSQGVLQLLLLFDLLWCCCSCAFPRLKSPMIRTETRRQEWRECGERSCCSSHPAAVAGSSFKRQSVGVIQFDYPKSPVQSRAQRLLKPRYSVNLPSYPAMRVRYTRRHPKQLGPCRESLERATETRIGARQTLMIDPLFSTYQQHLASCQTLKYEGG